MNLYLFVAIIALVCLLGFFNEKVTKLTYEISLMLFSIAVGALLLLGAVVFNGTDAGTVLKQTQLVNIERFLLEGVLCFMLFAGSCHMKLSDFKAQARQVTVLAFVCTLLGAVFYGALFFGASVLLLRRVSFAWAEHLASCLPDVRQHYRAYRPDCCDEYSQQIRFAEKYLVSDSGRIAF